MPTHLDIARRYADFVAHGTGRSMYNGRSSRVTYTGYDFYSYNTVIMRVVEHNGVKALLVSSNKYSNSTCKHRRYGESAVEAKGIPSFRVPHIGRQGSWNGEDVRDFGNEASEEVHRLNVRHFHHTLIEAVARAEKRYLQVERPWWGWQSEVVRLCTLAQSYMRFFNLAKVDGITRKRFDQTDILAGIRRVHEAKMAVYLDPRNVKKREQAKARRLLRTALMLD